MHLSGAPSVTYHQLPRLLALRLPAPLPKSHLILLFTVALMDYGDKRYFFPEGINRLFQLRKNSL
jgi:hypothetical protein